MFDLHSHILPGLDDGAKTIEESMKMLRVAAEDGIKGMAATPHGKDVREAGALGSVSEYVETLNRLAGEETLDIKIYVGMENHLTPDLPELRSDQVRALPDQRGTLHSCRASFRFPFPTTPMKC